MGKNDLPKGKGWEKSEYNYATLGDAIIISKSLKHA
jgi:hypothetical protein